jgi:hypothetical protein
LERSTCTIFVEPNTTICTIDRSKVLCCPSVHTIANAATRRSLWTLERRYSTVSLLDLSIVLVVYVLYNTA